MENDSELVVFAVLSVVVVAIAIIPLFVLIPDPGLKRHDEALPTTITEQAKLPPLAQAKFLTRKLVTLASAKAEVYWGGTRCASILLDYKPLPGRTIAQATWYTNGGDSYLDCSITFNTDPTKVRVSFYHYCAALIHEYGHLAGFHEDGGPGNGFHSADRNNLMYPILLERNIPKTCKVRVYVGALGAEF